jgi:hypothetical protein
MELMRERSREKGKTKGAGQTNGFGSHAVLVEGLPQLAAIRIRLELELQRAESALSAQPDPKRPESNYEVRQARQLAIGGLGVSFPSMLLILESEPKNGTVLQTLRILREHGVSEEIRVAAHILEDKIHGRTPLQSDSADGEIPFGD